MAYTMYIALSGEDRIAIYTMDPETGKLAFQENVGLSAGPGPLAVDPQRKYLYAGLRSIREVVSCHIDPSTGRLEQIGSVSLKADPCFLSTDRRGHFLLSAHYNAGVAGVHPIRADGVASGPPIEWRSTAEHAHSIQTDPSNRYAFVPHTVGPNRIFQFLFDEETGKLTPNELPTVEPPVKEGPRHFMFHPRKDLLYFVNEQGNSVTAYHFDTDRGTLKEFQRLSTLPGDFRGENACAQIHITPSGKYLYASNRGHDSIACFAVDEGTGALSPLGQQPTEAIPRAFNLDPQGKFLYAGGLKTGRLASYRMDRDTGNLEPLETYQVGSSPMWVLILDL